MGLRTPDLPSDVWALVYEAAGAEERTVLRAVCRAARDGADRRRRRLSIWGHPLHRHKDPTRQEMSGLMRRLPRLRRVRVVFYNRKGCLQAMSEVRGIARARGLVTRIQGTLGEAGSDHLRGWLQLTGCKFERAVQECEEMWEADASVELVSRP